MTPHLSDLFGLDFLSHLGASSSPRPFLELLTTEWSYKAHINFSYYICLYNSKFTVLNVLSLSLMPSPSADGSLEHLSCFGWLLFIYQLNSFMKFWKPSSPKKSKEPGDELWEVPRWMRSSTSRTMNSSGISRFQPAARMLYHLALSEHSWASCRFPCVFWSLACTDAFKLVDVGGIIKFHGFMIMCSFRQLF